MPDIGMCISKVCPKRNECFRTLATPSMLQSYSDFYREERKDCGYFWQVEKKEGE